MKKEIADLTDMEVVQLCLEKDNKYFEEIVNRYKNLIFSVILKMTTDREEAKDLSQEVLIKVYKNLDKYNEEYKFSTWVIRITTNHIIDYRRKNKIETVDIEQIVVSESTVSAEQEVMQDLETEYIQNVIKAIPEIYSLPLMMYHQDGLAYQEIADALDIPLSKVKNRIFKARKLLKEVMEERSAL